MSVFTTVCVHVRKKAGGQSLWASRVLFQKMKMRFNVSDAGLALFWNCYSHPQLRECSYNDHLCWTDLHPKALSQNWHTGLSFSCSIPYKSFHLGVSDLTHKKNIKFLLKALPPLQLHTLTFPLPPHDPVFLCISSSSTHSHPWHLNHSIRYLPDTGCLSYLNSSDLQNTRHTVDSLVIHHVVCPVHPADLYLQ